MKLFFHKTIKFNENEAKSTCNFSSFIKKCRKWDRTLASIFGLLAFFTLMGIGIYNIFRHKTCTDCKPNEEAFCVDKDEENPRKAPASKVDIIKCTVDVGDDEFCYVICRYIEKGESLEQHINAVLQEIDPPCSKIYLQFKSTAFPEAQLSKGWLKNIKPNVTTLIIHISTLREINAEAFVGHPFKENLKELIIEETDITTLRKNSFLDLKSVKTFFFQRFYRGELEIEEKALTGMDNLTTLQVLFLLTSKDIINLIGDKAAPQRQLQKLVLRKNFLPELLENSLANIKESVREVHLGLNEIATIHKKTFSGMINIKILTLESNNLTTLEDGTFNSLSNLKPQGLELGGNNWSCTCSLQWLKDYFNNTDFIDKSNPPLCNDEIEFEDFEFCPTSPATTSSTASPETESTPTSTTSTSGTNPDCSEIRKKSGIKILQCKNERSYPKYKSATNDEFHTEDIIVEDQKVTLQLQELEGDPLEVKVMIFEPMEILKSYYLVWTSSKNKTKYGCETPLEDGMILQLERGTTYTFSVLYLCESETSPKCIFGLKTLPEWAFRTWISNKYQAVVIGITVLAAICIIGVATLATFLCIRRYPKLISGNKNLIIVKPKETGASAPSRELEEPQYWEPSIRHSSQGYLTPKYYRYDSIKYRPPLMRSLSERAVSSNTSIYEQPPQWRAPHVRMQNQRLELSERMKRMKVHVYQDYRPPLPPPNPGSI